MLRESIIVKYAGVTSAVRTEDILYIESSNKKVIIHTRSNQVECYGKLSMFEDTSEFFRCHRCYIVNMKYVVRYSAAAIELSSGQRIFMSRRRYTEFDKAYMRFLAK